MLKPLKIILIVCALIGLVLTSSLATVQRFASHGMQVLVAKKRTARQGQQQSSEERQIPMTDAYTTESPDPAKRALRRVRSKKHDLRDPSIKSSDIKKLILTEQSAAVNYGGPWSDAPDEPALPVEPSDAIVIADVTGAHAYLSNDKTAIYSEFAILVFDTLKDTGGSIFSGSRLTVERSGGALRFPSGKVLVRGLLGKPLPKMNGRYVFFLKHNDEGDDFSIVTAYELRGGKTIPLDGLSPGGEIVGPFAAYQQYAGNDESAFIAKLKNLTRSADGKPKGGQR